MPTSAATPSRFQPLIAELTSENVEAALSKALLQLKHGADLPLVMAIVRAFVQVGTPGLAVRLLRSSPQLIDNHLEIAALVKQLSALPSGEVSPETLDDRFNINLRVLSRRLPNLPERLVEFIQTPPDVSVFKTTTGNYHVLRTRFESSFQLVFPLTDHCAQARNLQLPPLEVGTGFLLVGVPSTPMFDRLVNLEGMNGYCPPLDIVETSAEIFALWLRLIENQDDLRDERLSFFVGEQAWTQYEQYMNDHPRRVIASHTLKNDRPLHPPARPDENLNDRLLQARRQRDQHAMQRQEQRYGHMTPKRWAQRFQNAGRTEPPLRIVGFTSRFSTVIQYQMRILADAFRRIGCEFDIYKEPDHCGQLIDFPSILADGRYDGVVVINHLRYMNQHRIHSNIPYVCWIQDHMPNHCTREAGQSIGPLDLVIHSAPGIFTSLYDYPADHFLPSTNLTDAYVFDAEPVPEKDREPLRCDIAFVGHGSEPAEALINTMCWGKDPRVATCLHRFRKHAEQSLNQGQTLNALEMIELMAEADAHVGGVVPAGLIQARELFDRAQRVYDRLIRHQTFRWAAEWAKHNNRTFKIFGKGWGHNPEFAEYACGELHNGYETRCAYQAAAIHLHATGYLSLHQRLLDGVVAGGCMLTRYNPADFYRLHFESIQQFIFEHRIPDIASLMDFAQRDTTLRHHMRMVERLHGMKVAPLQDPQRKRHVDLFRYAGLLDMADCTDEGYFDDLATMRNSVARVAGEISGFDKTIFADKQQLHHFLNRLVDDESARDQLMEPMREDILAHDTTDALAERIVKWYRAVDNKSPGASSGPHRAMTG